VKGSSNDFSKPRHVSMRAITSAEIIDQLLIFLPDFLE